MNIEKNAVVSIDYTLTDDQGEVIDSSANGKPLEFLFGHGHIIPGLEKALMGKATGDKLKVELTPEDGYGDYDANLVYKVTREQIQTEDAIEEGTHFQMDTPEGPMIYTVTSVEGEEITLDGNHPLAGQTLRFDVQVKGVRAATADEKAHGHIHGEDCHH